MNEDFASLLICWCCVNGHNSNGDNGESGNGLGVGSNDRLVTGGEGRVAKTRPVEVPKKRLLKRCLLQAPQAPFKAPIYRKCCIRGFRETGLALMIVLRCD